jgi:hypothetical protein
MALPDPWLRFAQDPRLEAHAHLRPSDSDRGVALDLLADAYTHGRLDKDEYDERSALIHDARTLADLPPLLSDVVPTSGSAVVLPAAASPVHEEAVRRWQRDRREALMGFLGPTLITWVVWAVVMFGDFPWPAIVTVATAIPLLQVMLTREDIVAKHEKKLQKEQLREIEGKQSPELE